MPDSRDKKSRTEFERGPKAAPGGTAQSRIGGNTPEEADRHLMNYHTVFEDGSDDDRYFRFTRSLVVAARRWRKVANDRIREHDQTMARWEAMFLVAFSGHGLTQSELAGLISVAGPTMVRMLDQLAQEGLIRRYQNKADARVTTNEITEKGLAEIAKIMEVTNALRADLLRDIAPEQLDVCLSVLDHILGKLDEIA